MRYRGSAMRSPARQGRRATDKNTPYCGSQSEPDQEAKGNHSQLNIAPQTHLSTTAILNPLRSFVANPIPQSRKSFQSFKSRFRQLCLDKQT
jgi:hypothetical protein